MDKATALMKEIENYVENKLKEFTGNPIQKKALICLLADNLLTSNGISSLDAKLFKENQIKTIIDR